MNLYQVLNLEDEKAEEGKVCVRCNQYKPLSQFQKNRTGHDNRCRECKLSYQKELREVRNNPQIPPMPDHCQCCGKENPKGKVHGATNLALDHYYDDHGNPFFRGWICKQCNSGIGYLGDTALSVYKAFVYLLNTLPSTDKVNVFMHMVDSLPIEEQDEAKQRIIESIECDIQREKNCAKPI